ncbi:MAG: M14 family metallopeptidase [Pirellulaceae bacterium]
MLHEIDAVPAGLESVPVRNITQIVPQPTLIHLQGRRQPAVFVSILLHGNEDVGLLAFQQLLRRYQDRQLPRSLSVFIGNVAACASGVRYLSDQVDFNRVWPGSELPITETHRLMQQVTDRILERGVFVSIDLHNNTGLNPIYGCICDPSPAHIYLASMFSRTVVYFTRPRGVQTQAFTSHCPSVTCECGQIGDMAGVQHAVDLIDACLHLHEFPDCDVPQGDVHIFHTVARIALRDGCSFGFAAESSSPRPDVVLRDDLDALNFVELAEGESIGVLHKQLAECFIVNDEAGRDVTSQFLSVPRASSSVSSGQRIRLRRPTMPSMFTRNHEVIRQDCLGYLMERMPIQ